MMSNHSRNRNYTFVEMDNFASESHSAQSQDVLSRTQERALLFFSLSLALSLYLYVG